MIPAGGGRFPERAARQPSRTYRLDVTHKRIAGEVDGLEAVRQAVFKMLHTRRFQHLIYSSQYGSEIADAIGRSPVSAAEMERYIREAVQQDDRVIGVDEVELTRQGDEMVVRCTIHSLFGPFQAVTVA